MAVAPQLAILRGIRKNQRARYLTQRRAPLTDPDDPDDSMDDSEDDGLPPRPYVALQDHPGTKARVGGGAIPKEFDVTDKLRNQVKVMVTAGFPQRRMCLLMGISLRMLRRHFKRELETGADEIHVAVAGQMIRSALAGSIPAGRYILSSRFGWAEPTRVGNSPDADGGPEGGTNGSPAIGVGAAEAAALFQEVDAAIRAKSGGHHGAPEMAGDSEA